MLLASFFSWWYGAGWQLHMKAAGHRMQRTSEFFSLVQLLRTLFAPYRQISAEAVRGNLGLQWRAFLDRTVSRVVGFCVRLMLLFIGVVLLLLYLLLHGLWLLLWPLLPFMPFVMIILAVSGVGVRI